MDLGATICLPRKPMCLLCPVSDDCIARLEERIDELPGRKARSVTRRKRVAMLVVVSRGEVLLEKRPARGIWGGLWSLPEADADSKPEEALRADWGLEASRIEPLAPFEHAFTHFTLEVVPWRIEPRKPVSLAESKPATWLALTDLAGAALPSPVRKLLQTL